MKPNNKWNEHAKRAFNVVAPGLLKEGVLTEKNRLLFEAFCIEIGEYFRMREEADNLIVKGRGQDTKLNPIIKEARRSLEMAKSIGKEFGLTPYGLKLLGDATQKEEKPRQSKLTSLMPKKKAK